MGLIKEPKNIDMSTKSEPWTEQELLDFRKIMKEIKTNKPKHEEQTATLKRKKAQTV